MRIEYERYRTLMSTVNEMFDGKHINIYEADRQRTPEGRRTAYSTQLIIEQLIDIYAPC